MKHEQTDISNEESLSTRVEPSAVLALVLQRFRLSAWRRTAWLRHVWQKKTVQNEILGAYHQEVDRILLQTDNPVAEYAWYEETEQLQEVNRELEAIETALREDCTSRLYLLTEIFNLNQQELDLLHICLAISLEPQLSRVCAYLSDQTNRPFITAELAARLFGYGASLTINPESPLKIWKLIQELDIHPGEPSCFMIDPHIRNWLTGRNELDEPLTGFAYLHAQRAPLTGWPVEEAVQAISSQMRPEYQGRARICISGISGSGRKTYAACVAERLNMPLLVIETDQIPAAQWLDICVHAYRQAYLDRCALAWVGKSLSNHWWPAHLPPFQVQFVITEPGQQPATVKGVLDYPLELPPLTLEETRTLLEAYIPHAATWNKQVLENLLQKRRFTIGQIADLAAQNPSSLQQATTIIKSRQESGLGSLAQQLATPFGWDDLVVAPPLRRHLEDFVFEATERRGIWERPNMIRLFPQGRGLLALFAGSPGTGKTMAAQVIAAQLDLPLFRIDLSSVVSKYVGETSKNLERILSQAKQMNVVLLFDEADALFGKRTEIKDAHDRFANTDTNYLLQAIEEFPGIAILTSNKKAHIDHGFIRRIRYVLEFPKPDAGQRMEIWRRILREMEGEDCLARLEKSTAHIAESMDLTGSQIKLSILSASIMARRAGVEISLEHLLRGVEREWMKEGRGISLDLNKAMHKKSMNHH